MVGYRQLARNRDFTVLWTGDTVNELGTRMSMFTFPLITWALTGSTVWAAIVEAAFLVALSATLFPAGVIVDRFHRQRLMAGTLGVGALAFASLAVAGAAGALTIGHLVAVAAIVGACNGLYQPAQTSAIRSVVETDDLPAALSSNQARVQVAELVGGPLGGVLYAVTRWAPFAVNAATHVVAAIAVLAIRTDLSPEPRTTITRWRQDLGEGFRFTLSRPFFRVLLTWASAANLVTNALFFVAMMRLIQDGVPPATIGLVSAAFGTGGILGAIVAPYVVARVRTGWLAIAATWTGTIPMLGLIWWHGPVAFAVCGFLLLLPNPATNAGLGAYRMAVTPASMQGRVSSAGAFLAMSTMPLAPVAGGLLLSHWGGTVAMALLVAASALVSLYLTLAASVREVPKPADWPRLEAISPTRP